MTTVLPLLLLRSVFRHYRVTQRDQGGYVIDVENPVSVFVEWIISF